MIKIYIKGINILVYLDDKDIDKQVCSCFVKVARILVKL
jgi:hypothetical protein